MRQASRAAIGAGVPLRDDEPSPGPIAVPPAIIDGVLMDSAQAQISVTDEGLLRGDGVFEVIPLFGGRPFALDEHLKRMARSAASLRLALDIGAVRDDVAAILAGAAPVDATLRVLVTRGGRRIALIEPPIELPATQRLATITYAPTRVLDGIKSLSYAANMLATRLAQEQGADQALLVTPHGRVLEGPTTSFFYVLDGQLYTPPLSERILDSITRRLLISLSEAQERVTACNDLASISEAFLTSSSRPVQAVSAIDDIAIEAAPGPVSTEVAERAREHIEAAL
jgi:branched-chain amino acid aminotransferase